MEDHFSDSISVNDIAFHMGLDRSYLYRIFKPYKPSGDKAPEAEGEEVSAA